MKDMVGGSISSAYLVALGNNRNNGRSLGLFTVNANNALNNANANNWRPRLSTRTRTTKCRNLRLNRSRRVSSRLRASHTTQSVLADGGVYVRIAVKDLHTTCVSRAEQSASGTHSGKGDRDAA